MDRVDQRATRDPNTSLFEPVDGVFVKSCQHSACRFLSMLHSRVPANQPPVLGYLSDAIDGLLYGQMGVTRD